MIRPYQRAAVDRLVTLLCQGKKPILVAPTGSGKTFIMSTLVAEAGVRSLFVVHRRELTAQLFKSCKAFGLDAAMIQAGSRPDYSKPIQVASIQTLTNRTLPKADLLLIDEAHHCAGNSYRMLLSQYSNAGLMGATATPARLDRKPLGDIFTDLVIAATGQQLCDDGVLVEPTVFVPDDPDLSGVKLTAGEYNLAELGRRMDKPKLVGNIVETWQRLAAGKRTVAFAVNIEHSRHIVERFREAGVSAAHVDGSTPTMQRAEVFTKLRTGEYTVVSNVGLVNEGFDLPALECAVIARPTASLTWHLQAIGRIARVAPEKTGALVLDHAGNHLRHGTMTEDRQWSLTDDLPKRRVDLKDGPPMKRCDSCFILVPAACKECPHCGFVFPVETTVPEEADGQLVALRKRAAVPFPVKSDWWDRIDGQRRAFGFKEGYSYYKYRAMFGESPLVIDGRLVDPTRADGLARKVEYKRLAQIAAERGYKPGWAAWKFKARFGRFPNQMEKYG